jgi:hypothetical protein
MRTLLAKIADAPWLAIALPGVLAVILLLLAILL